MPQPGPLIDDFSTVLAASGGVARPVSSAREVAAAIEAVVAGQDSRQLLYAPFALARQIGLQHHLAARNIELVRLPTAADRASRIGVGLTGAAFAIAETGTLIVGGQPGAWGLASVLPWVHVVLLRAGDILPDLPSAFATFSACLRAGEGDWVWITGPSRTADIGHTLVLGAHGPNALHVLILQDAEATVPETAPGPSASHHGGRR
ncbi:MAG: lactate utilization protein C [Acidobacteriota bacterium]